MPVIIKSGTLIILKNCDRLDFKKPETIIKHLKEDLGMTYRYFVAEGKRLFINGEEMELDDPLMTMKNHKYHPNLIKGLKSEDITEETGYSKIYEIDPIPVEYDDLEGNQKTGYIELS